MDWHLNKYPPWENSKDQHSEICCWRRQDCNRYRFKLIHQVKWWSTDWHFVVWIFFVSRSFSSVEKPTVFCNGYTSMSMSTRCSWILLNSPHWRQISNKRPATPRLSSALIWWLHIHRGLNRYPQFCFKKREKCEKEKAESRDLTANCKPTVLSSFHQVILILVRLHRQRLHFPRLLEPRVCGEREYLSNFDCSIFCFGILTTTVNHL